MIDQERLDEFKRRLADRFTAYELVELLDLDVWSIIELFEEEVIQLYDKDEIR